MFKRLFLILIITITISGLKAVNHSFLFTKCESVTLDKSYVLSNLSVNSINTCTFIAEIEDNFSKDKFHNSFQYNYFLNYYKHKIHFEHPKVSSINSQICYTNLYRDVPFYMAIGNFRI